MSYKCENCKHSMEYVADNSGFGTYWCKHCGTIMDIINEVDEKLEWRVPKNLAQPDAYSLLADVRAIVDDVIDTIPYYAYGDNEAAVRMIEALHKIRDKVGEHFR